MSLRIKLSSTGKGRYHALNPPLPSARLTQRYEWIHRNCKGVRYKVGGEGGNNSDRGKLVELGHQQMSPPHLPYPLFSFGIPSGFIPENTNLCSAFATIRLYSAMVLMAPPFSVISTPNGETCWHYERTQKLGYPWFLLIFYDTRNSKGVVDIIE